MPKVEYVNHVRAFAHAIVDQNRGMDELANPRPASNWTAEVGERPQQRNMVEQCVAETFGSRWELQPGVFNNLLEVC